MRHRLLFLFLATSLLLKPIVCAQLPEPPGKREIAKYPLQLEPPPPPQKRTLDPVKLRAEANELADLAHSVPAYVDQVSQGKLPKDFADKLKRIEKLSKQLRNELNP
ncbi:MAG TPA: hypothetical protein VKR57_05235 [Terriglobales bacterium]|jgi:hypothetical protein|nr:hypothetical protein [Terriglobales bacterium]